jgi:hypothetical protein
LQDKFAVVVARTFGFPQFLRLSVRVFLKVNASISAGACGMDGTDEVWVAGKEETAMAMPRLTPTHCGSLGIVAVLRFWSGFSLLKIEVLVAIAEP